MSGKFCNCFEIYDPILDFFLSIFRVSENYLLGRNSLESYLPGPTSVLALPTATLTSTQRHPAKTHVTLPHVTQPHPTLTLHLKSLTRQPTDTVQSQRGLQSDLHCASRHSFEHICFVCLKHFLYFFDVRTFWETLVVMRLTNFYASVLLQDCDAAHESFQHLLSVPNR